MASLKETGMGIGDFAQALLKQEKDNPQPVSHKAPVRGNVPDIENVQVLQEDVNDVLADSFPILHSSPVVLACRVFDLAG